MIQLLCFRRGAPSNRFAAYQYTLHLFGGARDCGFLDDSASDGEFECGGVPGPQKKDGGHVLAYCLVVQLFFDRLGPHWVQPVVPRGACWRSCVALLSSWLCWWRWCGEPWFAEYWNGALYLGALRVVLGGFHNSFVVAAAASATGGHLLALASGVLFRLPALRLVGRVGLWRPLPPANTCSVHSLPTLPSVLFRLGFRADGTTSTCSSTAFLFRLVRLRLLAA